MEFTRFCSGIIVKGYDLYKKRIYSMLDKKVNINKWKKDLMPEICMLFLSIKGRTPGVGRYWSGCAQASRWSLEISGIAAIDVDNHFAFHLEAVHEDGPQPDENLLDWYGHVLYARKGTLAQLSSYIVADTYFAKKPFVDKVLSMQMHLISRLRDDADLKYLFTGKRTGQRGRPRKHDGKTDWTNLNHHHFSVIRIDHPDLSICVWIYCICLCLNVLKR
jgi:hypothetical protein